MRDAVIRLVVRFSYKEADVQTQQGNISSISTAIILSYFMFHGAMLSCCGVYARAMIVQELSWHASWCVRAIPSVS